MKRLFYGCVILLGICILIGCNNSNKLDYTVLYNQEGTLGYKIVDDKSYNYQHNIITSYQQLVNICDEWNNNSFEEEAENYNSELSKLIRSCDENYFIENDLIIISFETSNYLKTKIKKIEYNNSQIKVELKQTIKNGTYTTEAYPWMMIIKIDKLNKENIELIVDIR